MQILIFIILALLLVLLIKTLHSFQAKKTQESVQQSTPLSLLESPIEPALELKPPPSKEADLKPTPERKSPATAKPESWQDKLKALRAVGEFQQALAISSGQYPKTQAFQQSLVTLRAQIKHHQQTQSDATKALEALYHVAASSDLFRSGNAQSKNLKQTNSPALLSELGKINLPYSKIGYENLLMLNKSDIKHFVQAWQEPEAHCHTEEYLGSKWEKLIMTHSNKS